MSFHQPDDTERQVSLRGLLEELIESRRSRKDDAPDTDASGLMRLIADRLVCDKRVHVQILKPTPVRTETYEDVEMLRHYSGGEGVTVAILMYLTIVQLRAQNVLSSRRLQDAGFLLLDNPFGKCNREDLVRMQVQLAEHPARLPKLTAPYQIEWLKHPAHKEPPLRQWIIRDFNR